MATTQTLILCPQCLAQIAIREDLPAENPSVMIHCPKCGLGQVIDTTSVSDTGATA